MNLVKFIDFLRDRLPIVIKICYVILGALVFIDITVVDKSHVHHPVEKIWGWWSLFGFVACVLIIFISKWYGHQGIMTREDYYDD
jgi:hypothetical protein